MPIVKKKTVLQLEGHCTVEEAEDLLQWLDANPRGRLNLRACTHCHTAIIQVLMARRPLVSAEPDDPFLRRQILPLIRHAEDQAS